MTGTKPPKLSGLRWEGLGRGAGSTGGRAPRGIHLQAHHCPGWGLDTPTARTGQVTHLRVAFLEREPPAPPMGLWVTLVMGGGREGC